jgi:hypothetical protein
MVVHTLCVGSYKAVHESHIQLPPFMAGSLPRISIVDGSHRSGAPIDQILVKDVLTLRKAETGQQLPAYRLNSLP